MHQSAFNNGVIFINKYLSSESKLKVLDVGSYDVNGTLKPLFDREGWSYTGMDVEQGPNVDVVLEDRNRFPFDDESFDAIVSTSCFEHDEAFWLTFAEIVRTLKTGGYIYLNAPSTGPYHGFPGDCWRFYKDAWAALAKGHENIELIEQYIDPTEIFEDNVGVFQKIK
ncbi:MAG: methyltransferase domain-containing protein [Gammaproteobacteria bacterium]